MSDLREDGNLESDNSSDFSLINTRLISFNGSSLSQQVPAERLAQAGFYFTGQSDRVRCFSCRQTVENWHMGDTPVERHKEVSPSCKFLRCTHRTSFNPGSANAPINGSIYSAEAEDMDYRLRTGSVVDETTYPMVPHMRREEARLKTFTAWPSSAPVRPRDLAEAGLYYLVENDRVQCFCCGGMLGGWQSGDTAWGEHSKHFPHCFFILGHDVGNIPFEGAEEETEQPCLHMHSFEERLQSFADVQHPIDHDGLARAGFYSTGRGDMVVCFRCGGGLKGWRPDEDPWEEHAKNYPGCSFVLAEKGPEFVSSIQLQGPKQNGATSSHQNGFSGHTDEVLQSAVAQKAIEMGVSPCDVEKTILDKMNRTGSGYSSLEALLEDCLNSSPDSDTANTDEDPLEKLKNLQMEKLCKICMDSDISIVFIPCGHLVSCEKCSKSLSKCPICCGSISQKIKIYNS